MSYKSAGLSFLLLVIPLVLFLVFERRTAQAASFDLIPRPANTHPNPGEFILSPETCVVTDPGSAETTRLLIEQIRRSTGFKLPIQALPDPKTANQTINVSTATKGTSEIPGAYRLAVRPGTVRIQGADPAGTFYATQTLLQLLPAEIFSSSTVNGKNWSMPCGEIEDQPRFGWRGFLLDVARHFFTKNELKRVIDTLAVHKLNILQLHLTDDQGWRIEIRKYPRLTEIGAWRRDIGFKLDPRSSTAYGADGRYGGFYAQEDMREIIAYASARQVTVVPEIEMPSHGSAALTAYPQFSCSGGPYTTECEGGIFAGVFCPGTDDTFEFIEAVLAEVIAVFPGPYIHIGGDEVPKENWKKCPRCQARKTAESLDSEKALQSYFIRRIERFVNSKGRKLVGWSEIREGGLPHRAILMDWIGGAVEAASAGHDVVMTPTAHCYLDYYQSTNRAAEPQAIGGFLPLDLVYAFEPVPASLSAPFRQHILGAQGNLWTEYIASLSHAQYMTFPRLCALSEVAWTPPKLRSFPDFEKRLQEHVRRLDQMGVNHRK
jgi:hexosaminidase